jgi:hypothetical protein
MRPAADEVFATRNTIEEDYPLAKGGMLFILIAGVSQLPGLAYLSKYLRSMIRYRVDNKYQDQLPRAFSP